MRVGQNNEENSPTMHLSQAISAYAPGKQVVKNEWIYQPAGILMKTKYDDNTTRYVLQIVRIVVIPLYDRVMS